MLEKSSPDSSLTEMENFRVHHDIFPIICMQLSIVQPGHGHLPHAWESSEIKNFKNGVKLANYLLCFPILQINSAP